MRSPGGRDRRPRRQQRDLTPRNARRRSPARATRARPHAPSALLRIPAWVGRGARPLARIAILLAEVVAVIAVVRQPAFAARSVEVTGLHHVARADVLRRAGLLDHPSVFLVSAESAEQAIRIEPYVRSVSVESLLPGRVRVLVQEWEPVAYFEVGDRSVVLNAAGDVLGPPPPGELPPLHVKLAPGRDAAAANPGAHVLKARLLADLSRMVKAFPQAYNLTLEGFELDVDRHLVALTVNGPRILFGQMVTDDQVDSLDQKLASLAALGRKVDLAHSHLDYVNLEKPSAPVTHEPQPSPSATPGPGPSSSARPSPRPSTSPSH